MTRRHPKRAASAPASGIVTIEPTPRHSSMSPSTPSSIAARALAKGTSGAQAAMTKPAMKNDDARGQLFATLTRPRDDLRDQGS